MVRLIDGKTKQPSALERSVQREKHVFNVRGAASPNTRQPTRPPLCVCIPVA